MVVTIQGGAALVRNKRKIGEIYEDMAAKHLLSKGYEIVERNFRGRGGELDIVARKGEMLVVCEVKYRSTTRSGNPLEAVDSRKQMQISKMFAYYSSKRGISSDTPVRFDVIGINGAREIVHIENAFLFNYGR